MGVRFPSVGNNTIVNTTLVTTAETIVATSQPLTLALDFALITILWWVEVTFGTGTTTIVPRIRRGNTLTGSAINVGAGLNATAGQSVILNGVYVDTPGAVAGQQYSLTLAQGAATANGSIQDVAIVVFSL